MTNYVDTGQAAQSLHRLPKPSCFFFQKFWNDSHS